MIKALYKSIWVRLLNLARNNPLLANFQKPTHYARYGVKFDDIGRANAKHLLAKLKFNGTKLCLRNG